MNRNSFFTTTLLPLVAKLFIAGLVLVSAGCVAPGIPIPIHSGGHQFRVREIAFLNESGITRSIVIENLGNPLWISENPSALGYVWEMTITYAVAGTYGGELGRWDKIQRRALFLSFNEHDQLVRHEVRILNDHKTVAQNGAAWATGGGQ